MSAYDTRFIQEEKALKRLLYSDSSASLDTRDVTLSFHSTVFFCIDLSIDYLERGVMRPYMQTIGKTSYRFICPCFEI